MRAAAWAVAACIFFSVQQAAAAIALLPGSCAGGSAGLPYNQLFSATGGVGAYTYAVTAGALPSGLSLASNGAITGTPLSAGVSNFTITATDTLSASGSQSYSIAVAAATLTLTPGSLPSATVGVPYTQTVSPGGGTPPYTVSLASGSLPNGLLINASGTISGTPTTSGSYSFFMAAVDAGGVNAGIQFYTLQVGTAGALTIAPGTLSAGTRGVAYSQTLNGSGGTAPYTFSQTSGALPAGVTLSGAGALSGTPTVAGSFAFTIATSDVNGNSGSASYSLAINAATPVVSPATLPSATRGQAYSQTISASGGTAPYTFSVTSGALPPGLSLSGGVLSGTPSSTGSFSFTIGATDAYGNSGSQSYTVPVNGAAVTMSPATISDATRGVAYSQTFSGSGGTAPYTFSLASGTLPAGLVLSSGGVLSGAPSAAGAYAFVVAMTDGGGNSTSRSYAFNVANPSPTLTISPSTLPPPIAGQPYNQQLSGSGGGGNYTYTVTSGALPPGLTLSTGGTLSGTPTSSGTVSFTITITDGYGATGTQTFTVNGRVDPSQVSDLRGMISAQATSARRFAATQIENVSRHLENIHQDFGRCMVTFGIVPQSPPASSRIGADDPVTTGSIATVPASPNPVLPRGGEDNSTNCTGGEMRDLSVWSAGSAQFGYASTNGAGSNRFASSGITIGVDRRFGDRLIVGVAAGYGASRDDIGANLSKTDATSKNGVVYASLKASELLFLSLLMGGGALEYANTRFISDDGSIALSRRAGAYQFVALIAGTKFARGPFTINPYLRGDYLRVSLGDSTEQGGSQLLQIARTEFASKSVVTGLRTSVDIPTRLGVIAPMLRGEYRYSFDDQFRQTVRYTDTGFDMSSTFSEPATQRQTFTGGVGIQARVKNGVVEVEYAMISQPGSLWARMIRLALRFAW